MKKILILLCTTGFLSNCATNSNTNTRMQNIEVSKAAKLALADKNSDEKIICKQVKKTGSNRITTVCEAQSIIEARRQSTQRELGKRVIITGPSGSGSGGN